jgi:YD repeat-containing protein
MLFITFVDQDNMKIEIITDLENVEFPIIIKDKKGNEIYKQYEDGFWGKYTYDDNGNVLTFKNIFGFWFEYTYDDNGKVLTCKDSDGDWCERTYNDNGNLLTHKHSNGFWYEYTYDDNGNRLTYKNSKGYYRIKGKDVTKEEFEVFPNAPEYTMEELTAKLGNFKIKK